MSDVILQGVVGSTAYGLATPDSDVDILGVYVVPLAEALSIGWNSGKATRVTTAPDSAHHEVAKFLSLVVKGNPTVTELLWLDDYSVLTDPARCLVAERHRLLGWRTVTSSYLGYASGQVDRLLRRSGEGRDGFASDLAKRTAKHGRHCWRLLLQAEHALRSGEIMIDVSAHADEIVAMGELAEVSPVELRDRFEVKASAIKTIEPVLPEYPDRVLANKLLFDIRMDARMSSFTRPAIGVVPG